MTEHLQKRVDSYVKILADDIGRIQQLLAQVNELANATDPKNRIFFRIIQNQRDAERTQLLAQLSSSEERGGLFGNRGQSEQREVLKERLKQLDSADAKAQKVPALIAENNTQILNYSKEDTILIYEQRAITDTFGTFDEFQQAVGSLYENYVGSLAAAAEEGGV